MSIIERQSWARTRFHSENVPVKNFWSPVQDTAISSIHIERKQFFCTSCIGEGIICKNLRQKRSDTACPEAGLLKNWNFNTITISNSSRMTEYFVLTIH
jgi:hypothetical protein